MAFDLRKYARAGVVARLEEIENERKAIRATFPELRESTRRGRGRLGSPASAKLRKKGRRRRMSAEARKRISEAQKKRWAAQKAARKI